MPMLFQLFAIALAVLAPTSKPAPTIEWDRSTLRLVAEDAWYPRIIILKNGDWLAGFSRGDGVWSSRSRDAGKTWQAAVRVAVDAEGIATNSELIALGDGRVMYLFNERDVRGPAKRGTPELDNGIAAAFSSDDGKTWSKPTRIYGGGPMWEPAAVERDGELLVFFADEKPYPTTNEQQISMLTSKDAGKTWAGPTDVSFRAGHRDGMPVPAILADGLLVLAIEDDGINGTFKPAIVALSDTTFPVAGTDRRRWSALAEPLRAEVYAGAPYVVRLGARATVLSAQVAEPGGPRQMAVWVGDAAARNFAGRSAPFAVAGKKEQLWSALLPLDEGRLLAITGTTIEGRSGVWMIEGRLVP